MGHHGTWDIKDMLEFQGNSGTSRTLWDIMEHHGTWDIKDMLEFQGDSGTSRTLWDIKDIMGHHERLKDT